MVSLGSLSLTELTGRVMEVETVRTASGHRLEPEIDRLEHQPIRFPDIQSGHNPKVEDWLQNRLVNEDEGDTPHSEVSARSEVSSHSVQPGPMNSLVKYRKPEPVAIRPEEPITVWNIQSETLLRGAYNAYSTSEEEYDDYDSQVTFTKSYRKVLCYYMGHMLI